MISYYQYYSEIKNRLILLSFAWGFSLIITYLNKEAILFLIIDANKYFNTPNVKSYFIFTNIIEVFQVYFELVIFLSNQITLIVLGYHIIMFLVSGLYKFEFIKLKLFYKIFLVSWFFSIILLYKFIIPFSWSFFISFQENSNNIQPISFFFEAKIIDYIDYFINLYYLCFINCQFLAILTFFLINLSDKFGKTKTFRKLFYLIFVIFSTIITPPDIISQIFMSVFLIINYEIIIFIKYLKFNMATN